MRLFNYLEHDCQQIDVAIALEKDADDLNQVEKQLVDLLCRAQSLELSAADLSEEAEQHQSVHDWYCAAAQPAEGLDAVDHAVPLDDQLAQLRALIKENLTLAAAKVSNVFMKIVIVFFFQWQMNLRNMF